MCSVVELLVVWNFGKLWCGNHVSRLALLIDCGLRLVQHSLIITRSRYDQEYHGHDFRKEGYKPCWKVQAILRSWHDPILTIN